jgi:hypothetical protein
MFRASVRLFRDFSKKSFPAGLPRTMRASALPDYYNYYCALLFSISHPSLHQQIKWTQRTKQIGVSSFLFVHVLFFCGPVYFVMFFFPPPSNNKKHVKNCHFSGAASSITLILLFFVVIKNKDLSGKSVLQLLTEVRTIVVVKLEQVSPKKSYSIIKRQILHNHKDWIHGGVDNGT